MSKILQTIYASVTDDIVYHTLELSHASFPGGFYRWVLGYESAELGLESGQVVTFEGAPLGVSLPSRGGAGNQHLQFQLDNVTGKALNEVSAVIDAGEKLPVVYRVYRDSNKSSPDQSAIRMTAVGFDANYHRINIAASFYDFVNKKWPTERFTLENSPGLKYV